MSFAATNSLHKPLVLALTVAAALMGTTAATHAADSVSQVKVSYADLDLSQEADAKRLYQRLRAAANRACDHHSGKELYKVKLKAECVSTALNRAVLDVSHAAIFALHSPQPPVRVAEKESAMVPST